MNYRDTQAFIIAAYRAARQNTITSARARRGTLANVGRNPLTLKARKFAACEVQS